MAPVSDKSSHVVMSRVRIAGIEVDALVDTGATSSCCRWDWYYKWQSHLGPLRRTSRVVVGVENFPIELKGVLGPVEIEWDQVNDKFEILVLPTLEEVDVIIGMDVLSGMDVTILTGKGRASPGITNSDQMATPVVLDRNVRLPAGKSRTFFL